MMAKCEIIGCVDDAEFYDNMDNKICEAHMNAACEDGSSPEDYELITLTHKNK